MSMERIPMSEEGYEKKKAELNRMQNREMIEVAVRIAAARELGDLSENAEYTRPARTRACSRPASTAQGSAQPGFHRRQVGPEGRRGALRGPRRGQGP